ncbi:hypothetical protein [Brevibacterium sp. W7.2]|uniref:DUF7507 domain-containing protein n=1 Tax=Brevibacterium sp. W7.2 TaxID=2823518 RepID=UPI001BA7F106|nr:hypothetical protein [Brevibacterium sp. W7.2]
MRDQHGFAPRLTRACVIIATILVMMFSAVPVAHADPQGEDAAPTPSQSPTPTEAPAPASDEPSEETEAPSRAPRAVAPQSVPTPSGNNAVITVKVGGDRTAANSVSGLAGVTLRLYDGDSRGPSTPVRDSWATCTSDGDGDCSFTVPETGQTRVCFILCRWDDQANRNKQFWVVQESSPNGWSANDKLVIGSASSNSAQQYTFRTGTQLRAGSTYRSGSEFMTSGSRSNTTNSTGTWQNSRTNPALEASCTAGLRVALVLDLSGSVETSGALGTLKDSAKGMVDALKGTNSSMALYTFASNAPRDSTDSGRNWPSMSIDPGDNANTIKSRIDAYAAGGGTNWDSGLWQVANANEQYDLAVVVTDGLPTYSSGNTSTYGNVTSFDEIEAAIYSANAIKAGGSRIMAVGVGDGIQGGVENLAAISGPAGYSDGGSINDADYFQAGWEDLAILMENVAKGATCRADIEIVKQTLPYGADSTAPGGAGWTFGVTASAPGTLQQDSRQTTGENSTVGYQVRFSTPKPAQKSSVDIEEILTDAQTADGWTIDAVDCTVNGAKVSVDKSDISLDVTSGDTVKCTVTNKQTLVPGVSIEKKAWDTPTADGLDGATEIPAGDTVTDGTTITWTYLVTNTGKTPLDGISVVDDRLPGTAVTCPKASLNPGETMTCSASGAVTK